MSYYHISLRSILRIIVVLFIIFQIYNNIFAQSSYEVPFHTQSYNSSSGSYNGIDGTPYYVAYSTTVQISNATWLQIQFSNVNLANNSYIKITSVSDGFWQQLNATSILEWNNTSAFFNDNAVTISLNVAMGDEGVSFTIDSVNVGDPADPYTVTDLCGDDNRVSSTNTSVGRLLNPSCTAWIIADGQLVTRGPLFF